jgi:hypothetical protein
LSIALYSRLLNGHCNVPRKPGLGVWLHGLRRSYKLNKLTSQQIALFEGLGVNWTKLNRPLSWEEGLKELEKFKKTMRHCQIFMDPKSPSPLAKWAWAQRLEYKRFRKQTDSLLDAEKIGKLNEIGFKWKTASGK